MKCLKVLLSLLITDRQLIELQSRPRPLLSFFSLPDPPAFASPPPFPSCFFYFFCALRQRKKEKKVKAEKKGKGKGKGSLTFFLVFSVPFLEKVRLPFPALRQREAKAEG